MINFHWHQIDEIKPLTPLCTAQGIFLQTGDSATAFFVILIALHTLKHFLTPTNPDVPPRLFRGLLATVWAIMIVVAIVPRLITSRFYTNAGPWCWISGDYQWSRIYLHYLWLFLAEAVSIVVYIGLGIHLWLYGNANPHFRRVAKTMFMYPITYTLGTLPLATARAFLMSGRHLSNTHLIACAIIFSALGSVNCCVYVLTRRSLIVRERDAQDRIRRQMAIRQISDRSVSGPKPVQTEIFEEEEEEFDDRLLDFQEILKG